MKGKMHFRKLFVGFVLGMTTSVAFAEQIQSDLGRGVLAYDLQAGVKDRCIVLNENDFGVQQIRQTQYSLVMVKTKEELFDKITTSVSGEGSYYSFSAGMKFQFMKQIQWNYNSVYLWLNSKRITNKEVITKDNLLLTTESRNLMLDSNFKFAETCGSKLITEIEMGGEIFGVIEIVSDNYEEKQKLEASLEASGSFGVGSASGAASYERTINSLKEKYSVRVKFKHIGGKRVEIPQTPEELVNLAKKIEDITDDNPVQIGSKTREYSTVANSTYDVQSPEVLERQDIITTAEIKLKEARAEFANGLYVLAYAGDFKAFSKTKLETQLSQLEEDIFNLKRLRDNAYSFQSEVDETILFNDYTLDKPSKRRRSRGRDLRVECSEESHPVCGVAAYKKSATSYCGVKSVNVRKDRLCGAIYKEAANPKCGVKLYVNKASSACGVARYKQCHHSSCGRKWDGSRKRCRTSGCGVEAYNSCRNEEHGVEAYHTCRDESFGVEDYLTCSHPSFGYQFLECEHFSHGPESYKACQVATIGKKVTFCPSL